MRDLKLWVAKVYGEKIERLIRGHRLRCSRFTRLTEHSQDSRLKNVKVSQVCIVLPLSIYRCYIALHISHVPKNSSLCGFDTVTLDNGAVSILAIADHHYHGYRKVWDEADFGPLVE